jgi:hypothetical protein
MKTYLRNAGAVAAPLILAACTTTSANIHPNAASSAVDQNAACLTQTGSRLDGGGKHCSAFGRSYSSTDVDRTGATMADEALRLLDPSITVHR